MRQQLTITVLAEDTVGAPGLLAEHGLALWIEAGDAKILFDTGQGLALIANAKTLGIDFAAADTVVLSHGHYDHTGGLLGIRTALGHAVLYVHPRAFDAKFTRRADGTVRQVGSPIRSVEEIRPFVRRVVLTEGPTQVAQNVMVTGRIPRSNDFEDTGGPFFLDEACTEPDPLLDDQALYIDTPDCTVVVMGCGHAGLVNTLSYVSELTRGRPIHTVLGGFHLVQASDERIGQTLEALEGYDVQRLSPAHCTGRRAIMSLWQRFPNRCVECRTGSRFEFASKT
ncbi:MAG: MBL fold metallo-hydrolase [Phycisphaerales bacterium]|nr:MAG: MBL fold metallo-hydrolase [Phycisphaerales bacterium]